MKLKTWLKGRQMSHRDFAELIGVSSRVTVSRYVSGGRIPSRAVMARISEVTGGAVTANDFYAEEAA